MADTFLDLSCNLILFLTTLFLGLPVGTSGKKNLLANAGAAGDTESRRSSEEGNDNPPVLLPGKSHGWKGLAEYSPWALKGGHN